MTKRPAPTRSRVRSAALIALVALAAAAVGGLYGRGDWLGRLQPTAVRALPILSAVTAVGAVGLPLLLPLAVRPGALPARRALAPADLQLPRFELRETIPQQDILPFVQRYYLHERTWPIRSHYALSVLTLLLWTTAAVAQIDGRPGPIAGLGWAVIFTVVIILPVHEALHAAAYKAQGAPRVQFGGSWRKLYAYAVAPDFVIGRRDFLIVALLPTVAINSALLLLLVAVPALATLWAPLLLIHVNLASGDWALVNYIWMHRHRDLYTYDTAGGGYSYIYESIADSASAP